MFLVVQDRIYIIARREVKGDLQKAFFFCFMQELIRRECAFSYNLSHYILGGWSLKIESGP